MTMHRLLGHSVCATIALLAFGQAAVPATLPCHDFRENPGWISTIPDMPGSTVSAVAFPYVYMIADGRFWVASISDPAQPEVVGETVIPLGPYGNPVIVGPRVCFGSSGSIVAVDVTNPAAPAISGTVEIVPGEMTVELAVSGSTGYAAFHQGVAVFDLSGEQPLIVSIPPDITLYSRAVAVFGDRLVVGGYARLSLFDIAEPESPSQLRDFEIPPMYPGGPDFSPVANNSAWHYTVLATGWCCSAHTGGPVVYLEEFDLSDPGELRSIKKTFLSHEHSGVEARPVLDPDGHVYVSQTFSFNHWMPSSPPFRGHGVSIFDGRSVSGFQRVHLIGTTELATQVHRFEAGGSAFLLAGAEIFDIDEPERAYLPPVEYEAITAIDGSDRLVVAAVAVPFRRYGLRTYRREGTGLVELGVTPFVAPRLPFLDVVVLEDMAFLTTEDGVFRCDLSDPLAPGAPELHVALPGARTIKRVGGLLAVSHGSGITTFAVSALGSLSAAGSALTHSLDDFDVRGMTVFAISQSDLVALDFVDPGFPVEVGRVAIDEPMSGASRIAVRNNLVAVTQGGTSLRVYDVTSVGAMREEGRAALPSEGRGIFDADTGAGLKWFGLTILVTHGGHGILAFDASDPARVRPAGALSAFMAQDLLQLGDVVAVAALGPLRLIEAPCASPLILANSHLTFTLEKGQTASTSVDVSNSGETPVSFEAGFGEERSLPGTVGYSVEPHAGSIAPGGIQTFVVTVDGTSAARGGYERLLRIDTTDPPAQAQILVSVQVDPDLSPARIPATVRPRSLEFAVEAGQVTYLWLRVKNMTALPLPIDMTIEEGPGVGHRDVSWLSLDQPSVLVAPGGTDSLRVRVDARSLEPGPVAGQIVFEIGQGPTSRLIVEARGLIELGPPEVARTFGVSPNPFSTTVDVSIPRVPPSGALIRLFDISGRSVFRRRVSGSDVEGGVFSWNGTNDVGRRVSPGVYYLHVESGGESFRAKLVRIE